MRRPPEKDAQAALSERDVISSNATLHALFGGARQKSWMAGPGAAPVRPTPRTSSLSKAPELPATLAQKGLSTVLPSPAPSGEPSPVLTSSPINGLRNGSRIDVRNEPDRRISTTTITEPTSRRVSVIEANSDAEPPQGPRASTAISRPSSPSNESVNPLPAQSRRESVNPTQTAEISTMEIPPLPSSVFLPSETEGQMHEEMLSPLPEASSLAPTPENHSLPFPQTSSLSDAGSTSRPALTHQQEVGAPNSHHISRDTRELSPSRVNTTSASRTTNSQPPTAHSYPSPNMPLAPNPNKRQRTQAPVMPSLKGRVILIEKHIESCGGWMKLNSDLERLRFQFLKGACEKEDPFYVALHQIFCTWDTNRAEVANIQGFPHLSTLTSAFHTLGQLIRDNEHLAASQRFWFSNFPSPLRDLLRSSEPYRNQVADVGVFLRRLANQWGPLSVECMRRKYPPLADELVEGLGLLSPILQSIAFTASRRNLGIRDEEVGTRMEDLFRRDQREHQALVARYNTARPPTAGEVQQRNATLAKEYLTLYSQVLQRSSAAMAGTHVTRNPSPVIASNTLAGNGSQHHHPMSIAQPVENSAAWHRNVFSPDPNANWQTPHQNQQVPTRASDSSPNPSVMASHCHGVGGYRVYPNAPSPPLLQGLSLQSPAQQGLQFVPMANNHLQTQQGMQPAYPMAPAARRFQQPTDIQQYAQTAYQQQQQMIQHLTVQQQQQQQQQQRQHQQNIVPRQQQQQFVNFFANQYGAAPQTSWPPNQPSLPQNVQLVRQQQQMPDLSHHTQMRHGSNGTLDPLRPHVRTNSTGSNGPHTPSINPPARPPTRIPAPHALPLGRIMPDAIMTYSQKPRMARGLIPPLNYLHPPQPTVPDTIALHQAHLRSPRLVAADVPSSGVASDSPSLRFYQAIREFALQPTRVPMNTPLSKLEFRTPKDQLALIAQDIRHSDGQVPTRNYKRGTLQYRLRCVKTQRTDLKWSIADWVLLDTVWPESASLSINQNRLELRRKSHHGKDQPVDVTACVRDSGPDGISQVSLSIIRGRSKWKEFGYYIAVELIEILQHDQIVEMVGSNRIAANVTLEKIKRNLAGPADDHDDDIAMVVSDLSIDLADPFSARIFDTPVRGSGCLHRECFDLKTFLLTRNSKPKRPGQPCMIGVWKCPLCGKDARPYSLVIDDFLVSVRQSLEAQGNLDVKAIWVGADGKWRPKIEKRKSMRDPNDSDFSDDKGDERQGDAPRKSNPPSASRVVIELDDF
ncbi:hypothetical protein LZ554_000752 [Drepanopeziza brunnea f. sp. 'monogermtubi']|nr:hypothetical protein LZ554_000752 [Drepanopeziza brunnea f. sp. 'monogermtubi']